ncbi:MAG: hypothetical protein AAGH92_00345 [Planctomycetota bacterium]
MSPTRAIAVWCLLGLFVAAPIAAQELMVSPRRLVRLFDFEETNDAGVKIGRGLPMPRGWYIIGRDPLSEKPNFLGVPLHRHLADRPGYPPHARVGYDADQTASGDFSLGLHTQGGNAGAYLASNTLIAVPGSDYLVTAKVRTAGLIHAGAVVKAYFIDAANRRIEESVRITQPLRSGDDWLRVDLKLPGRFPKAVSVGIELHLVQPTPETDHPLGDQQIVLPDVAGSAWFDDIAVWQLPSVSIQTQADANLIRAPEQPRIAVDVRDLIGQRLVAEVVVYDHDRRAVARDRRPIFPGSPSSWQWTPELPGYGWYLTELSVYDDLEGLLAAEEGATRGTVDPVARTYGAFHFLPAEASAVGGDARRFTLDARGLPEDQLVRLPDIIDATGFRSVAVSAWDRETTRIDVERRAEELDQRMASAMGTGDRLIVSMHPLPRALQETDGINTDESLTAMTADPSRWMPFAQPVLSRMGQWVNEWQIGDTSRPEVAAGPGLAEALPSLRAALEQWTPTPTLWLPGALTLADDTPLAARHGVARFTPWPHAVTPDALRERYETDPPTAAQILRLRVPGADELTHTDRVADVTRRVLEAWRLDETVDIAIGPMWTRAAPLEPGLATHTTRVLPDPVLGVFANLSRRLAGRRYAGEVDLGPGLRCWVFEPTSEAAAVPFGAEQEPRGGVLVAWNETGPDDRAAISLYLGQSPRIIDVWGNTTPAERTAGKHTVALSRTPVFIENVDLPLAQFRASFILDEPFIPSTQVPHQRTIRFTNPWPMTINGRFTFTGPRGWTINPQRQVFALAPGATVEMPVAMSFPVNEPAGDKRLSARFEFTADRDYVVDMGAPMGLGLEDVRLEASLFVDRITNPGQADIVVTCILTNVGDNDQSLNVFVSMAGFPFREGIIPRLEPGQAAIRRFRFENAGPAAAANPILCGVRETNGPAVLNKHLRLGRDQ